MIDWTKKLNDIYEAGDLVPFIGAGLSVPFGIPDWPELIRKIAERENIDNQFMPTILRALEIGDYFYAIKSIMSLGGRNEHDIQIAARDIIVESIKIESLNKIDNNYCDLAKYGKMKLFLTTNYDGILGKIVISPYSPINLGEGNVILQEILSPKQNSGTRIYHLHGTITKEDTMIITEEQYNRLYKEHNYFNQLFDIYSGAKTYLFMGFSFKDVFIQNIIRKSNFSFKTTHYILLDNPSEKEIKDLKENYNIETISYNSKNSSHIEEIRKIIDKICTGNISTIKKKISSPFVEMLKKYHENICKKSASYYLSNINSDIFPALKDYEERLYFDDQNKEVSLVKYFDEAHKIEPLIIVGEGGIGKTVTLLKTCEKLLNKGFHVAYIPLNELNRKMMVEKDKPIYEFLYRNIWKEDIKKQNELIMLQKQNSNLRMILLLDGFNEVIYEFRDKLLQEIDELLFDEKFQIVFTSRFDFTKEYTWLGRFKLLYVQPLKETQITNYLLQCNVDIPNKNIMKLLNLPLMLTLYANTEGQYKKYKDLSFIKWEKANSSGAIIWNFLQCQIGKATEQTTDIGMKIDYIIVVEYVVAYIGYRMELESEFTIDLDRYKELLEAAKEHYLNQWENTLPERLNKVFLKSSDRERILRLDIDKWINILDDNLRLFVESSGGERTYMHQQFRDCYAAIFLRNEVESRSWIGVTNVWRDKAFSYYVVILLAELFDKYKLKKLWDSYKGLTFDSNSYELYNILQVLKNVNQNKFYGYDFSFHDLRNISLRELDIAMKCDFNNAMLSNNTLMPSGHIGIINKVIFLKDNKKCLSASDDGSIKIWDILTGNCLYTFNENFGAVQDMDYFASKDLCISLTSHNIIALWDIKQKKLLKKIDIQDIDTITSIAFMGCNMWCIIGTKEGTNKILDLINGKCLQTLKTLNSTIRSIACSADGRIVVNGGDDNVACLWNLKENKYTEMIGHSQKINCVACSESGQIILTASNDNTVRVWDNTGHCKYILPHVENVRSVSFTSDGMNCISGCDDKIVRVWDLRKGELIKEISGHRHLINSLSISSDNKYFISGSYDNTARLWDYSNGTYIRSFEGHNDWVRSVTFTLDGKFLISGSYDKTIKIWDLDNIRCCKILHGHKNWVRSIKCLPDKKSFLSGSYDNTIRKWNMLNGKCEMILTGHSDWISEIDYSPDGKYCISGSYDNTIKLWDLDTGEDLDTFVGHTGRVRSVSYSPNGDYFASGSYDGTIRIWSIKTKEFMELKGHNHYVRCVTFTPNGNTLISGSYDKTIKIWDVKSAECIHTLEGHTNWIRSICCSPNGQYCVSGSDDKTIVLWDLVSFKRLYTFEGHENWVGSVAFSPDNKTIVSGSDDNTMKIWDIETKECLITIKSVPNVDIVDSDFKDAKFETLELKELVRMSGGIVN